MGADAAEEGRRHGAQRVTEILKKHVPMLPGCDGKRIARRSRPDGGATRATGEVAVCMASSGPGATNLVTALIESLHHDMVCRPGHTWVPREGGPLLGLGEAIERATDAAVGMLIARLEELVDTLPRSTLEQLASEQLVAELGQE